MNSSSLSFSLHLLESLASRKYNLNFFISLSVGVLDKLSSPVLHTHSCFPCSRGCVSAGRRLGGYTW